MEKQETVKTAEQFENFVQKLNTDEIEGAIKYFTIDEKNVIQILYGAPSVMTIKEIRNQIALAYYIFLTQNTKLINIDLQRFPTAAKINTVRKSFKKDYRGNTENNKTQLDIVLAHLRKANVQILSYETVDRIVNHLRDLGFVINRESGDRKTKMYWTLNPRFYALIKEKKIPLY